MLLIYRNNRQKKGQSIIAKSERRNQPAKTQSRSRTFRPQIGTGPTHPIREKWQALENLLQALHMKYKTPLNFVNNFFQK